MLALPDRILYTEGASVCQCEPASLRDMKADDHKSSRKPRVDSIRNRERLLDAAAKVFGSGAGQASLEAVARQAGVGIGTLYRHFPTREALFEAVYRHEVDQLFELAEKLARSGDPVEALRKWLHANVRLVATKKGMAQALQLVGTTGQYGRPLMAGLGSVVSVVTISYPLMPLPPVAAVAPVAP